MRFHGNPERAKANLAAGRERSRLAAVEYRGAPIRPPERGALLKTLRVTDHIKGISYVVTIHQGDRLNNCEPRIFGNPFMRTVTCGFDTLFRALRSKWKARWLILN